MSLHHRHHGKMPGGLDYFRIGIVDDAGVVRGAAIVARPPNRNSDNGLTGEVVRCATDGARNGCSALYGACARIAREIGIQRLITYTLDEESGASLRAVGWKAEKVGIKSFWASHQVPGRTVQEHYKQNEDTMGRPVVAI